jgi:hypothetical protein
MSSSYVKSAESSSIVDGLLEAMHPECTLGRARLTRRKYKEGRKGSSRDSS